MLITVIGNRGTGKSTLACHLASQLNNHVIVYDSANQFDNADITFDDLDKFEDFLEDDDKWADNAPSFIVRFVPWRASEGNWDTFARLLWKYTGKGEGQASYSLIIDEANKLMTPGPNGINDWLDTFLRLSPQREKGNPNPVDIILVSHRPQDINGWVWENSRFCYIFFLFGNGLNKIEEHYGDEVAEQVSNLKGPQTVEEDGGGVLPEAGSKYEGERHVLRVTVATGKTVLLTDSSEWYSKIEVPKNQEDS